MWAKASSIFSSCKFVLEHTLKSGMGHLLVELLFQRLLLLACSRPLCFQHKGKGPVYKRPSGVARLLCSRAQEKEGRDQHKSTSSCMLTHHLLDVEVRGESLTQHRFPIVSWILIWKVVGEERDYLFSSTLPTQKKKWKWKLLEFFPSANPPVLLQQPIAHINRGSKMLFSLLWEQLHNKEM